MLVFLYLILGLISNNIAYGMTLIEAFNTAGCLAKCQKISCANQCGKNFQPLESISRTLSVEANFNASLLCRDVDFITLVHDQGFFVIEQRTTNGSWGDVVLRNGTVSSFSNLHPGAQYQYRAYRVTAQGISHFETTPWFTTAPLGLSPQPIKSISLKSITPEADTEDFLQAEITFEPAKDPSCFYNVFSLSDEEGLSHYFCDINATLNYGINLHKLSYLQNNTIIITSENSINSSSPNISWSFVTPSCYDIYKNLSRCPPNKVTGFRLSEVSVWGSQYNLLFTWDQPEVYPLTYDIQIIFFTDEKSKNDVIEVSGNLTETLYSVEKIGQSYSAVIIAESAGGPSPPVTIHGTLNPHRENSLTVFDVAMITVPTVVVIIVCISIIYIYCRRKKLVRYESQYKYCSNLKQKLNVNPLYEAPLKADVVEAVEDTPLVPKDHFEVRITQLRIQHILGSGVSGIVRLGLLRINQNKSIKVAVKMLKDYPSPDEVRNFQREISLMKSAGTHPNIVSILGCCTSDIRPILIVEYCSKGDLQSYLRHMWKNIVFNISERKNQQLLKIDREISNCLSIEYRNQPAVSNQLYDVEQEILSTKEEITAADLLNFARQIANGMEFLASSRIVHRDLAARNVLLCADRTIKISDFGLSRDIYCINIYKKQGDGKLPLKWMALEALTHQIYTTQSDVWSFGILLWEIVTLGSDPYPEIPIHMVLQRLKTGYRMPRPANCGHELYDVMTACWRSSPRSRPTFTELKRTLDKLLQSITHHEYLNLDDLIHEFRKTDLTKGS